MKTLRWLLLLLIARPIARFLTGADVSGREHLPLKGPAIVVANHNSHMDTLLLLTIFPSKAMSRVRPAAASDYFLKDPMIGWVSRNLIGIVPVARDKVGTGEDVLAPAREALTAGDIIVVFPEGTRGNADDEMARLKSGVARLAEAFPEAPVTPIWIQGAGRVLPKGEVIPVPMNCAVLIGPPVRWAGKRTEFMDGLREALMKLKEDAPPLRWS
ncbi:MAG: lysophospholipid acyltransferase family protein [Pseudomonadota bacterium]